MKHSIERCPQCMVDVATSIPSAVGDSEAAKELRQIAGNYPETAHVAKRLRVIADSLQSHEGSTKRAEWLANPKFEAGMALAGIGTFWDAFEKDNGRAPLWDELEPVLCKALDAAEKKSHRSATGDSDG